MQNSAQLVVAVLATSIRSTLCGSGRACSCFGIRESDRGALWFRCFRGAGELTLQRKGRATVGRRKCMAIDHQANPHETVGGTQEVNGSSNELGVHPGGWGCRLGSHLG